MVTFMKIKIGYFSYKQFKPDDMLDKISTPYTFFLRRIFFNH